MIRNRQYILFAFRTCSMSDGSAIVESFTVTTDDGSEYESFELPGTEDVYEFNVDFMAQTLRFDVSESTGGNTGAVDIAAYGEPVE